MDKTLKLAGKIKDIINKGLKYLRVNDEKGLVSLTNIAMILIIYKIARTPAVSFQDITALAVAVMGYQGKRLLQKSK